MLLLCALLAARGASEPAFVELTAATLDAYEPLVLFYATDYCDACRAGHRRLEYLAAGIPEAYFGIVYCEREPALCRAHGVARVPAVKMRVHGALYDYPLAAAHFLEEDVRAFVARHARPAFAAAADEAALARLAARAAADGYVAVYDSEGRRGFYEPVFSHFLRSKLRFGFFPAAEPRVVGVREGAAMRYAGPPDDPAALERFVHRVATPLFARAQLKTLRGRELRGFERAYALVARDAAQARGFAPAVLGALRGRGDRARSFCWVLRADPLLAARLGAPAPPAGAAGLLELARAGGALRYRYRALPERELPAAVAALAAGGELAGWERAGEASEDAFFRLDAEPGAEADAEREGVAWEAE